MVIPFKEFRKIKDSLPDGSINKIAAELQMDEETVRNYFGGSNYQRGRVSGVHFEKGADGGFVRLEDEKVLECAKKILDELSV